MEPRPAPERPGTALPQRRRVLIAALAGLAVIALAALGFGWWAVSTQGGARWAFEQLGGALPGEIQVGRMRGPIRGPLEIHGLLYRNERAEVLIDRISIDWRLRALTKQRLDIRSLDAEGVHVTLFAHEMPLHKDSAAAELPDVDLPLDFMVKRARVRDIEILPANGDSAFRIDDLRLADAAFRDTLTIGSLVLRSARLDADVAGRGYTRGRYGANLDVAWTWRPLAGEALHGRGRIVGDLDTLHVVQRVTGAYRGSFTGAAYRPLRGLTFQGLVEFDDLPVDELVATMPRTRATGRLDVRGSLARFSAAGDVAASIADYGRWNAALAFERDTNAIRLERVELTSRDRPSRVVARGVIVTRGRAPRVDLVADWTRLGFPLEGRAVVSSAEGNARMTGPLEQYRLSAEAALATTQRQLGRWRVEGAGTPSRMRFSSIEGQALGGRVSGRGEVDWRSDVDWRMDLAARGLDSRHLARGLPGTLGFDLRARGTSARDGARGELAFDSLSGDVRGLPVWGAGAVGFAPGAWSVPAFDLGWGPNLLVVTGEVAREWDLAWNLDAPDVSRTMPHAGGSLRLQGSVSGPRARPHVVSTLEADSLRWQGGRIHDVAGDADLDLGRGGRVRVDVRSGPVQIGGRQFDRAALTTDGQREDHAVALAIVADEDSLNLGAQGALAAGAWRGRLTKLDLASHDLGAWNLERDAPLVASLTSANLEDFCWRSGAARWCAEAVWRREGTWRLESRLENVPLALLEPALPPTVGLDGPMSGTVDLRSTGGLVLGDARLALGPGTMTYPNGSAPIHPSTLAMRADAAGLETDLRLSFAAGDTLHARVETPQPGAAAENRVLGGTLHLRLRDLGFVQGFVPELANTSGLVSADLRIAGTTAQPRWSGTARLENGAADIPHLAVELRQVTLDATGDEQGRLELQGAAASGPGRLELRGNAQVSAGGVHRAEATLKGERFQVANSSDARVLVSPDLGGRLRGDSLVLTGEVVVPEADVRPRPRETPAVRPSPDVVFVDTLATEKPPRRAIQTISEVRLTLGRNVRVRAYGLDAKVTGSILAVDRPDLPTTGSGEFALTQGVYRAYGQNLTVERGRLLFAGGPLANPGLDVRASRHARDGVVAGFEVTGTLSTPILTVFSEPAMAQRDALAYVILGHRIEKGNQSQEGLVTEAANALGVSGGSYVAGTLARKLGIDEAAIESQGGFEDASLMLGTYLSPRLYVNYGVGLLDPESTLRIQYFLSNKWTLQAETGSENRADILYTIER